MLRDATVAYDKAKEIGRICKSSKTLEEALERAKSVSPNEDLTEVVKAVGHYLPRS